MLDIGDKDRGEKYILVREIVQKIGKYNVFKCKPSVGVHTWNPSYWRGKGSSRPA
jgi:hypothetical protein